MTGRALGAHLDDVSATADPAIHEHRHALAHSRCNAWQRVQAGRGKIQLAPTVIADNDAIRASLHAHAGILWAQDSLHAQPVLHPCATGASTTELLRSIITTVVVRVPHL